ncbi:MAG: serine/threonine protein kinase, partial [Polyangiales bacterium]
MKVCPSCGARYGDDAIMCGIDGQPLLPVKDALIGRTVGGRHRLISRLGAGGMSAVYLARHVLIDRLVAVKTLRRDLAKDPVQRDRFVREARAVNRINHENIVEITDFGETHDGIVYLVMEFVPGEPLKKALEKGRFDTTRALRLCREMGSALGRAHEMGVVHRDLKPDNILLTARKDGAESVKILDFGIAKILDAPSLTGSQQIFGTPGYIAPEYIQSMDIDGRSDLYSLGVILYEMATGALPFDYEYPGDLLVKHVTEAPIPPSARYPEIQPALEVFILRCLEKLPDDRFRDAYHFLDELELMADRLGGPDTWSAPALTSHATQPPPEPTHVEAIDAIVSHTIPAPPPDMVGESSIPQPPPLLAPERDEGSEEGLGPVGVRRWRERFDALDTLARNERGAVDDGDVAADLEHARQLLVGLEECVADTAECQHRLEALATGARDFRVTLGRAIDRLARSQSVGKRNELRLGTKRRELRASRAEHTKAGDSEGRADALLWEQAAVEQVLRDVLGGIALGKSQLGELRDELTQRNDEAEAR